MKKTSLYIASLAVVAAAAFSACDNDFEVPPMVIPTSDWTPNTTIEQFKADYWSTVTGTAETVGLNADGDSIIIKGRVCSSDQSGNIFKSLVIQGESEALTMSLDFYDIYQSFKYGQEVYVNVTGLTIGQYGGLMTLGYGVDDRGRVARTPEAIIKAHAQGNGLPSAAKVDTVLTTIADLNAAIATTEGQQTWQSRLVRINNVQFETPGLPFAEGSTTSRYIVDAEGNKLLCYNSSYADFKDMPLPAGAGSVVGILSQYTTTWQLLFIDAEGMIDFNGVAAPVFTPGAGIVAEGTKVTITCATEDASIYYTTDGTEPTASSTLYTAPIEVTSDVTIKAIALKDGHEPSVVVSAAYKVGNIEAVPEGDGTAASPFNASQARAQAESGSTETVYVKGYVTEIAELDTGDFGNATYYISNDGSTDVQFYIYRGYYLDGAKFTSEDQLKVGDLVVVNGQLANYQGKSPQLNKGNKIISINGEGGSTPQDPTPGPTGDVIFSESFTGGNLGQFTATVETSGTWTGWRANTATPLCAIANSYVNKVNEAATAWLVSPEINLAGVSAPKIVFEQAFGFYFPTSQESFCTINIREKGGEWNALTLTTFPEKGTGNWTGWAENTLDIAAYAGKTVEIGFKYVNDGKQSVAWEIRNLSVNK